MRTGQNAIIKGSALVLAAMLALSGRATGQNATSAPGALDAAGLKAIVTGLGYEPKDLNTEAGKEKYEFTISKDGLNVPISTELSGSKNYIWLTANLGANRSDLKFEELLKKNYAIQPCQFYITGKNYLMIGVAIDNRGVTAAVLRRNIDMLANNITSTKSLWMKQ